MKNLVSSSGGSITLYAIWKVNVYTYNIKYVSSSGLSLGTSTVSGTYGSSTSVTAPVKSGYNTPTAQTVNFDSTSTKTITFTYKLVNYTINYSLGGGSISGNKTSYNVETATFSLPAPTRTGYTFKGWTGSNGTTASTSVSIAKGSTGDKSYTANWTANTYTINYNANGGTGKTASSSHTYGTAKALTSNGFSRTGYTFLGWSTNSAATSATYTNGQSVSNLTATNGGTVTLYAIWKVNSYTYNITYKSSTGKALGTSTVSGNYGSSTTVSAPAKTGYTTPSSQTVNFDSTSAKTITFTYPIINYTIGYTLNSGTVSGNPTSYNIESAAITLKNPTRTGYTFKGWTGSNGTTASTSVTIAAGSTGNKTYTANWTVNNYTATFNGNGGSNGTSITKAYGSQLGTLPTTSRTGYTFKGWFTAASGGTQITTTTTMPASNVTYYAQWTAHTYTVAYNANGGSGTTMASSSHTYGTAKALTSNTYTRTGYTFAGWATSASGSVVYSNGQSVSNLTATNGATVTLYAKWTPITYTIAYNGNGNTGGSTVSSTHTYDVAKALTSNGFNKTGYSFAGWATSTTGSVVYSNGQSVTNVRSTTGTTTLYAKWNLVNYSITYNLNGGTNSSSNPSSYNVTSSTITLANPTRTGYTFAGWFTDSSFTNSITSIAAGSTGNKTLYAKWNANSYTIAFNGNGNTGGSMSSLSMVYGTAKTLTSNAFTKTGYTFQGWATSSSATTATYTNGQSVNNLVSTNGGSITLYAVWKANTYTVAYNGNGNTGGSTASSSHTYGTAKALTSNGFTKTGYTFAGWATSSSGSVVYSNGQSVSNLTSTNGATVTLYAKWNVVNYSITYNLNGGTNSSSNPSRYNITSSTITLANPTRTGYTFGGWYSDSSFATKVTSIASGSTGNKTLYAKWTANSYTISFNGNGNTGGSMSNLAMTYGTAKTLTSNGFTKTGYTFAGWATSASGAVVYSNGQSVNNLTATAGGTVTLYAKWTANTYTVAYNGNGNTGGSTASSSHTYGVAKTLTANGFTKTGHNFAGWSKSSSGAVAYSNSQSVSNLTATNGATVTLYAKWNPWTHTVAYNANGGSGAPSSQTKTYGTSLTLSSTKPTRTGYTFAGWNTNSSGTGTNYSAGGSYTADQNGGTVTLYAKWTANSYTVTFNANGGSTSTSSKTVTYASTYGTLPTPTRTGYTFKGWYTASSGGTQVTSSSTVSITANQTLYAKWTANTYTLTFNANGGSVSPSTKSVAFGSAFGNLPTPTRPGYTFKGWFKYSYGGTEYTSASIMDVEGLTIYANWTQKVATLVSGSTFNSTVSGMLGSATKISFTSTAIPSSYLSTAKVVSDSTSSNKIYAYTDGSTVYISPDEANVSIVAGADASLLFSNFKTVTNISLTNFKVTSSTTTMKRMFYNCNALTSLDLSNFTTTNVTDMSDLFYNCYVIKSLDLSKFKTNNVTTMYRMFYGCKALTSLTLYDLRGTNFNTAKVTDMSRMFENCSSITSLPVAKFDTSKVTNMLNMFSSCSSLTSLTLTSWNTSSATNMSGMFGGCKALKSLSLSSFSTSKVSNMSYMFDSCSALTTLTLGSNFNTSSVTNYTWAFRNCPSLSMTITIRSTPTSYSAMFYGSATASGSSIVVNYTSGLDSIATKLVATKTSGANVSLGTQVYSILPEDNGDISCGIGISEDSCESIEDFDCCIDCENCSNCTNCISGCICGCQEDYVTGIDTSTVYSNDLKEDSQLVDSEDSIVDSDDLLTDSVDDEVIADNGLTGSNEDVYESSEDVYDSSEEVENPNNDELEFDSNKVDNSIEQPSIDLDDSSIDDFSVDDSFDDSVIDNLTNITDDNVVNIDNVGDSTNIDIGSNPSSQTMDSVPSFNNVDVKMLINSDLNLNVSS